MSGAPLTRCGDVGILGLSLTLEEIFAISPRMTLALDLSQVAFIMLDCVPSTPSLLRNFTMKGFEFCQVLSLPVLR